MKALEDDELTDYMAYCFKYREPEGSEEAREYAEYRDSFGPMRMGEVKIKLGSDTFITAVRDRWNSDNLKITIKRENEKEVDKTFMLDELATKHTKSLVEANLSEWLSFFKRFHKELCIDFTDSEITYLDKLVN